MSTFSSGTAESYCFRSLVLDHDVPDVGTSRSKSLVLDHVPDVGTSRSKSLVLDHDVPDVGTSRSKSLVLDHDIPFAGDLNH